MEQDAIDFVAEFYSVSREEAVLYYKDEVEAFMWLLAQKGSDNERTNSRTC